MPSEFAIQLAMKIDHDANLRIQWMRYRMKNSEAATVVTMTAWMSCTIANGIW